MTTLTNGIQSKGLEDRIRQLDIAELLERACDVAQNEEAQGAAEGAPQPDASQPPVTTDSLVYIRL
jgi:hypothetical protein